jgi:prolyl-tRNA editing enzyme YbaK/EbsC (Cys-tRNA(Pro) deacylase)
VALHPTAQRFQERLHELGLDVEVRELSESTRTAADAAAAVGVDVGQIVKSLVFVDGEEPLLVLCAGDRRVDVDKLGTNVRQARGAEVRDATGFAIGGVPPLGHARSVRTVVDESLRRFNSVWCAAGTPNAVFRVETNALISTIPAAEVREVAAGFPAE